MENKKIIPHLLLCYDGTPSSYKALSYLQKVFEKAELEITILKIIAHPSESQVMPTDLYKKLLREELIEKKAKEEFLKAQEELEEIGQRLKEKIKAKIYPKVIFKYGDIAESIMRFSQENMFDGIVVGKRGLSKIATFILGGITHKLIVLSSIPVWLIRGETWNKKFLIALDLGETGLKLVDYVSFVLAHHPDAEITFFHIFYPFSDLKDFKGNIEELIEIAKNKEYKEFLVKIRKNLEENGIPRERIRFEFKRGLFGPAGEIIKAVKKENFSTVVIGRRGRTGVKGFFLGSVSQKIISYFEDRAIWVVN